MTSGRFHSIEISSIWVSREKRNRKEIKHSYIADLARSINRCGLIHPIVISPDRELITGECRFLACKLLGWTHISAQYTHELSEQQRKAIEYEENFWRLDLTWQENSL